MGREIRMVPESWEHPRKRDGGYKPLHEGYKEDAIDFMELAIKDGLQEAVDYMGCIDREDYMPDWGEEEKAHLMMYETTSEGTPISPAFKSPEDLAKWLADSGASSFGQMTATYEQWLSMCERGWAPSAIVDSSGLHSGVEAMSDRSD